MVGSKVSKVFCATARNRPLHERVHDHASLEKENAN